jgi:hypothetical protein
MINVFLAFSLLAAEPNQYGAVNLESLKTTGLIKLSGTSIENGLQLVGSLICQNGEIGSLDIMGEANLTGTQIKQASIVLGSLQATRSTFQKPLTLLSQKALFTASTLESITVRKDDSFKGKQILELRQGSIVNGPIHFESGKGEVIVYPGCQVLGPVTGGKVVKKS